MTVEEEIPLKDLGLLPPKEQPFQRALEIPALPAPKNAEGAGKGARAWREAAGIFLQQRRRRRRGLGDVRTPQPSYPSELARHGKEEPDAAWVRRWWQASYASWCSSGRLGSSGLAGLRFASSLICLSASPAATGFPSCCRTRLENEGESRRAQKRMRALLVSTAPSSLCTGSGLGGAAEGEKPKGGGGEGSRPSPPPGLEHHGGSRDRVAVQWAILDAAPKLIAVVIATITGFQGASPGGGVPRGAGDA